MTSDDQNLVSKFEQERNASINTYDNNRKWRNISDEWLVEAFTHRYMYNFTSFGRPIIQLPADMVAFQEIVWDVKPDLIIEMGIAHGGSLIQSAAMLAMLEYCDAAKEGTVLDPAKPVRKVLAVDIDIRPHNRDAIESHPLAGRIDMIQGSSIAPDIINKVHEYSRGFKKILVCLDSNHTHDHVLAELEAYAPLTSKDSYCLVFDTIVEDLPDNAFPDRPWEPGNSPMTAVNEYLEKLGNAEILATDGDRLRLERDRLIEDKLLLTVAPKGYLKRNAT
jgi:cephalosporin hydroxylase